jgi:hypothetical protein
MRYSRFISSTRLIAGLLTGLLFAILVVPLHAADSTKTAPPFGARCRSSILNAASHSRKPPRTGTAFEHTRSLSARWECWSNDDP